MFQRLVENIQNGQNTPVKQLKTAVAMLFYLYNVFKFFSFADYSTDGSPKLKSSNFEIETPRYDFYFKKFDKRLTRFSCFIT